MSTRTSRSLLRAVVVATVFSGAVLAEKDAGTANWAAPPYWVPRAEGGGRSALVAATPLPFFALAPCRVADTRPGFGFSGAYGPPFMTGGATRSFPIAGQCSIPASAQAVSFNFTVTNTAGSGFLRVFPQGGSQPNVSTLNYVAGQTIANAAVVPLGTGGGVTAIPGVSGFDLIIDVNGYYAPTGVVNGVNDLTGLVTLSPGANVTITPSGNTLTIASTASGGPPTGPAGGGLSGSYPNPTVVSTSANTPNSIVSRDGAGGFSAASLDLEGPLNMFGVPFAYATGSNTFLGIFTGNFSNSGGNTGLGNIAMQSITTGGSNTGTGFATLESNTVGSLNTALGAAAMNANTTSSGNTAVGWFALNEQAYSNSGAEWNGFNTAVGYSALLHTNSTNGSDGVENTAVGPRTLEDNSTGFQNTAVGSHAGFRSGPANGYAGPVTYVANTTGNYNTFIGRGTGVTASNIFNCTAVGIDAYCDGSNQVRLGNPFVLSIGGKVGWSALSDARAKSDIRDLSTGLDFVLRLRPVEYTLKNGNGRIDMGFLAQDIEALLGDGHNLLTVGGDPGRTLSLRYTDLIAPVVRAIQDQQAMLAVRDERIAELERVVRELAARLAAIEAR